MYRQDLNRAYTHGFVTKLAQRLQGTPPAYLRDIVEEVAAAFGDNQHAKNLMYGTAAVESSYGKHPRTYRKGYHGGVFQVDRSGFQATQNTESHPGLKEHYNTVRRELGVDWPSVTWDQLRDPRMSAIGARLLYRTVEPSVPTTRRDRAHYWKKFYNRSGKGTPTNYIDGRRTHPDFSSVPTTKELTSA